jgi:hypothetical protein
MQDEQFEQKAEEQETLDPHCMSCNMPMKKEDDFGTNADGTKNEEYCCHCLVNGEKK